MADINYQAIMEFKENIISYLEGEKAICEAALKVYEPGAIVDSSEEIRVLREKEAIKIRDRIYELSRHIKVIKMMTPS